MKTYNIKEVGNLLKKGGSFSTNTYIYSVFYMRKDGSIWMSHPDYNDRKYFDNLKDFKFFYKEDLFYKQKRQYNPQFFKYCFEDIEYGHNLQDVWRIPRYGSKLRKQALS